MDFARGNGFAPVQTPFCGAPDRVQTGQNIAAMDGEATHGQTVCDQSADSPKRFIRTRPLPGHFTQLLLQREPGCGVQAHAANVARGPVAERAESGEGGERAMVRIEADMLGGDRAARGRNVRAHFDGFVLENFAAGFPARGKNFPPEKASAGSEMDFGSLLEAHAGEGNNRVGNVFEERVFADRDFRGLHGRRGFAARAIDARGAGGGQLHGGAGADVDRKGQ